MRWSHSVFSNCVNSVWDNNAVMAWIPGEDASG